MIESIQYTKELPDDLFHTYTVSREESKGEDFKKAARQFCHYNGYAYLKDLTNWEHLVQQNVCKANLLISDILSWPEHKDDVEQIPVLEAQVDKHVVPSSEVAILNAFPMFLYYYFPKERFQK